MSKVIVLGTGNAQAIRCYNSCFAIENNDEYFLVDAGGGNGILAKLAQTSIPLKNIHHMFITHSHSDHVLGVVWIVRMIGSLMDKNQYEGKFTIYCHDELEQVIRGLVELSVQERFYRFFDEKIIFDVLEDGDVRYINGDMYTFFDIRSNKCKQFGFNVETQDGYRLAFTGDEPYQPACARYVEGVDMLWHEAFCRYVDRERFQPYEKFHVTVKEAAEFAEALAIPNLVLWHTEDEELGLRKEKYSAEAALYYQGTVLVPNDNEIINLL